MIVAYQKYILLRSQVSWSPRHFEQLHRIFSSTAPSQNDRFRFSARTSSSIFVRMNKNFLSTDLIFLANFKSSSVKRPAVKIRNVSYFSSSTFWQYASRSGKSGVPIPDKSQNFMLGLVGWRHTQSEKQCSQ